ncbi:MAG: large conductance mechanosensitive channel protein MscL [Actinomycetota bacterium]
MIKEFREFIAKGDLVTLAVAFILGVAFAAVVTSFTDVILGAASYVFGGQASFNDLGVHRGQNIVIPYGVFLTQVLNFFIIGFILFLVVRSYHRFLAKVPAPSGPSDEVRLLTEIRDELAARPQPGR